MQAMLRRIALPRPMRVNYSHPAILTLKSVAALPRLRVEKPGPWGSTRAAVGGSPSSRPGERPCCRLCARDPIVNGKCWMGAGPEERFRVGSRRRRFPLQKE